jgi:Holliday junction resolvasome RuvABC endonuclease subunit
MITISIKTLEKRFGYKIKRNVFILGVDTATKSGVARMWIDDTNVRIKTDILKLDINAKEVNATDEKGEKLELKMDAFYLMAKELSKSIEYKEGNILILENSFSKLNVWTYGCLRMMAGIVYSNLYDKFDIVRFIFPVSARNIVGFKSTLPKGTNSKDKKKEIMSWISNIVKEEIKDDNEADALLLALAGAKDE